MKRVCSKCKKITYKTKDELTRLGWNGCTGSINNIKVNITLCKECFTPKLMLDLMKGKDIK